MSKREHRGSSRRRHGWLKWLAASLLIVTVVAAVAVDIAARRAEPFLRALIVDRLSERFHARVELDSFHFSLASGLRAEGRGLRIWPSAEASGTVASTDSGTPYPLISLDEFQFHAPLKYAPDKPIHIDSVELRGLTVEMPPGPHLPGEPPAAGPPRFQVASATCTDTQQPAAAAPPAAGSFHIEIGDVTCTNAQLTIVSTKPGAQPHTFDIHTVSVAHTDENGRVNFDASLSIPRPKGLLGIHGALGPFERIDLGSTPLAGAYRLENADLSVFKGIAGMLSSTGSYQGTLRNLTVDGETDTPNFALTHFGATEALHTKFHALVDGTNGDTRLEPVYARLGRSNFVASGEVVKVDAADAAGVMKPVGREILLDVRVDGGRIEDFLTLTGHGGEPLLAGTLQLETKLDLPPGSDPLHQRLNLNGKFLLSGVEFPSPKVQARIAELSLRGQGKPNEIKTIAVGDVRSTMKSDFTLEGGIMNFPNLAYIVPGAEIDLHGAYGLEGGSLEFEGKADLQATVSQVLGGWKGKLAIPVDPLFRKGGAGTRVRVHVGGTREDPHFGVGLW